MTPSAHKSPLEITCQEGIWQIIPPPLWLPAAGRNPAKALSNLSGHLLRAAKNCQNDCRHHHHSSHGRALIADGEVHRPCFILWDVETWAWRDKGVRARTWNPGLLALFCCLCCVLTWLATVPSCWFEHYSAGVSVRVFVDKMNTELCSRVRQTALPVWVGLIQPVDWLEQRADSSLSKRFSQGGIRTGTSDFWLASLP